MQRCVQLSLLHNDITHHGTRFIGKILRSTSIITSIHLGGNWHPSVTNIGVAFKYLIEGLSRNTTCHLLSLAEMDLKQCHTHYIVLLIALCKGIRCLSLNLNHHLCNSTSLLASVLEHNSNLWEFRIDDCKIGDQQLSDLSEGLQHNQSLIVLNIAMNEYSVDAAVYLVRCLTSSSVRQVFMNREMTVSGSLQKEINLANKERSKRRGGAGKWSLTLEPNETGYNESVRSTVPSQVSEQLLRDKHAS